jgi:hypothetical protein
MNGIRLLLLGLATWNLSSLLVMEDGPWHWFARLRHAVGVRYDANSNVYGTNQVAEMLTCLWCTSRWVALALCALLFWAPKWGTGLCLLLSASTVAIVVDRFAGGD